MNIDFTTLLPRHNDRHPELPFGVKLLGYRRASAPFNKSLLGRKTIMLNWCVSGCAQIRQNDFEHLYQEGDVFVAPPETSFEYRVAEGAWESHWLEIDGNISSFLPLLNQRIIKAGPCPHALFDALENQMHDLSKSGQFSAAASAVRILLTAMGGGQNEPVESTTVQEACNLIEKHLSDPDLNVNWIVNRLSAERSAFSRSFSSKMSVTVVDYITGRRIQKATTLLHDKSLAVSDIANACGYQDIHYFSRVFKTRTGTTASDFRKQL